MSVIGRPWIIKRDVHPRDGQTRHTNRMTYDALSSGTTYRERCIAIVRDHACTTNANTRARVSANKAGQEALDFGSHCGRFCLVCNAHVIIYSGLADYEPGSEIPLCARIQYHCCHSKVRNARLAADDGEEGWCRPLVKSISRFTSYFLF